MQIGQVALRLDGEEWILSATAGILSIPTNAEEEEDHDIFDEGVLGATAPTLHEVLRFSLQEPSTEATPDGSHLLASARGALAAPAEGTFHLTRAPGQGTHATVDDGRFRSVAGDTFTLSIGQEAGDITWTARKLNGGGESGGWLEDNKFLLMGGLFILNIGLRLWSRSSRSESPKPTMAEKRAERKAAKADKGKKKD